MKHSTHLIQVYADPRATSLTQLGTERQKQLLDIGPDYIRTDRILENSPERFAMLAAELRYHITTLHID